MWSMFHVSGKNFKAIPSVVYAVGTTKDFEAFLALLLFITPSLKYKHLQILGSDRPQYALLVYQI